MADFPAEPMPPNAFFEVWMPKAFDEAELPPEARAAEARLGVKLEGTGGGEWLFHVQQGAMTVKPGAREEASFSVVQTVEDWRGALWEGRGGAIGQQAGQMFRPGAQAAAAKAGPGQMGAAPSPAALEQMAKLDGVIRMVVTGGQGGDWAVAFRLGPGPVPPEPTATLTIADADAAAMQRGELDPMAAFMGGKIVVTGDMTIIMQMQAIQMQAAAQAQAGSAGSSSS